MKHNKFKSKLLTLLILPILFTIPTLTLANTNAGIGPSSIFYFLDITAERVQLFFTWDTTEKINKILENANERLAEIEISANASDLESTKDLMLAYDRNIKNATDYATGMQTVADKKMSLEKVSTRAVIYKTSLTTILETLTIELQEIVIESVVTNDEQQEVINQEIKKLEQKTQRVRGQVEKLKNENEINESKQRKEGQETKEQEKAHANVIEKERLNKQAQVLEAQRLSIEKEKIAEQQRTTAELVKAEEQRKADQQQKEAEQIQATAKCLMNHYSLAQIDKQEKIVLDTLNKEAEKSEEKIRDLYDTQIDNIAAEGEVQLESAKASRSGFATNNAMLNQIRDRTERSIRDLEMRRDELISTISASLAQEKVIVLTNSLQMTREAGENVCY